MVVNQYVVVRPDVHHRDVDRRVVRVEEPEPAYCRGWGEELRERRCVPLAHPRRRRLGGPYQYLYRRDYCPDAERWDAAQRCH